MGHSIQDRISAFASGIDDSIKRIATEYDNRGLTYKSGPIKMTRYDNAEVGSGTVLNEVEYGYNDFGQLDEDKQSHAG